MSESDALTYLSRDPLNAELRFDRVSGLVTPAGQHYVRDHFAIPVPPDHLEVNGAVDAPRRFSVAELRAFPARSLVVTLECAGNGRAFLEPRAPGEQWRLGAVGTAEWTGVTLRAVLENVRPRHDAVELLFVGADSGMPTDLGMNIRYERSLSIADATSGDVLLAYAMNGRPLPPEHGAPLRLVVPGWYGMASVKWLSRIRAIGERFSGFYQKDRYVIGERPLGLIAPRAVITDPGDGARLARRPIAVRGRAWTGRSSIERVELSTDSGRTWRAAELGAAPSPHVWREWQLSVDPGEARELSLIPRAITASGESQPLEQMRNALGYANNAAQPVRVQVE